MAAATVPSAHRAHPADRPQANFYDAHAAV